MSAPNLTLSTAVNPTSSDLSMEGPDPFQFPTSWFIAIIIGGLFTVIWYVTLPSPLEQNSVASKLCN